MTLLTLIALVAILGLAYLSYKLHVSRTALQQKLSVVESRIEKVEARVVSELTPEQADWRDKLQAQYTAAFRQVEENLLAQLKLLNTKIDNDFTANRATFEKRLTDEFQKACDAIHFDEIQYKKTITKKRAQFNRKNTKYAKPQRVWRYIDEE